MKKIVKIVSLILAILMIAAVFTACGKKGDDKEKDPQDTVANTNNDNGGSGESNETTKVPDIALKNWNGQAYRVLGRQSPNEVFVHFEVWREEMPEDVVGKAVWNRNQDMYDNYGIRVVGYLKEDYNDIAKTMIESGDDIYDLMLLSPETFNPLAMKGQLYDLYTLDNINLDHDAWMAYPNKQLTMDGKLFYTTNKFLLQDKNRYWAMYYNRDMAKELNLGHFEDYVFEGTWTIDKVLEVAKVATYELDGEPGLTGADNWGLFCYEYYNFVQIAFGAGFRFTEHGADGFPEFLGATDEVIKRLDKVFSLIANTDVGFCYKRTPDDDAAKFGQEDCMLNFMFIDGRALVMAGAMSNLQQMGSYVDFDFGVIPNPKYDEKQEMYHTIPNAGNGSLFGVPATVVDKEFAGYALELISEKSIDTSFYAFIEVNSKLQKVQDEDAATCLQIIYDGVVYDIAFVNNIAGMTKNFSDTIVKSATNIYKRIYDRNATIIEVEMTKVREAYAELDKQ